MGDLRLGQLRVSPLAELRTYTTNVQQLSHSSLHWEAHAVGLGLPPLVSVRLSTRILG